ncbi:MAG: N-acetyltransferase family protein [Candidatus Nanopelagicales bacterium]
MSHGIRRAAHGDVPSLVEVLLGVVRDGASVGFMGDVTPDDAEQFWSAHLANPSNVVLVAVDDADVVGTATLALAGMPNGRHRAEVAKVLVRPDAQGRGLGRALLAALEDEARAHGRRTLVLDTVTGSPAQRLYESAGWTVVGEIDDYADLPDGTPSPTTYLTKRLT